jgi:hypothetical protein
MKLPAPISADYTAFLAEVKGRIHSARLNAGRAVNRELVLLYWDIGRGIVEKQESLGWGDGIVETLANDLQRAFPEMRGFAPRSLWNMRRFFLAYSSPGILPQLVAELSRSGSKLLFDLALPEHLAEQADENEEPQRTQRGKAVTELREAFGVRGACSRFQTAPALRQRQQAGRTPNASRDLDGATPQERARKASLYFGDLLHQLMTAQLRVHALDLPELEAAIAKGKP